MLEAVNLIALVWVAGMLLLLAGALVVFSALLERSGPIRLRHFAEEAGGSLRSLYDTPQRFEAFRYLLSFLAKAGPPSLCLLLMVLGVRLGLGHGRAALLALAVVLVLLLVVETANRALVGRDPEAALRRLTLIYRTALLLLAPLVALLAPLVPGEAVTAGEEQEEDEASDEEIEAFIAVGTREGILEPDEGDLVRGVVDFGDTQVRSVMTPRIDIVAAPVEASIEELSQRFVESRHSRLPLFRESIDHVVGIVHIRDLLAAFFQEERPAAGELAKPAYFVPVTKPLDELLRELQARFQQMAIAVDEYGGTAGLVTVEDLVEEIVGDIADEHEEAGEGVQALPDGSWRLDGRTHIEELDELFSLSLDDGPYETVGGLILSILGEVPEYGAVVETHGLRMTVEQVSDRRIQTVRVEKLPAPGQGDAG